MSHPNRAAPRALDSTRLRRCAATTAMTFAIIVALASGLSPMPTAGAEAAHPASGSRPAATKLFVRYATRHTCNVYLNYPKSGVRGNDHPFKVPAGRQIIWRYNVDSTWAMVSYPNRAHRDFPWWGFTRRSCIGRSVQQSDYPAGQPVPRRILEGRSRVFASGWRPVEFNMSASGVARRHVQVTRNATLRDPANFVIGNVPKGWHVDTTTVRRSKGHWVKVYVPNARRWGYIENTALH